ncbi:Ig-like domain-containing protein, partial [Marinomonas arenicola]
NTSAPGTDSATVDTTAAGGTVTVDDITGDDVINVAESKETITVTGTAAGGDIAEGDTVSMTINGSDYDTAVKVDGTWSVDVAGSDLAADTAFDVVVASSDAAGNTVESIGSSTHTLDQSALLINLDIDQVTNDGVLNSAEASETVTVTGQVTGDDFETGTVTLLINNATYTTTVSSDGAWSVDVAGSDLQADSDKQIEGSVSVANSIGQQGEAGSTETYLVDTSARASIRVNSITSDDVLNAEESLSTVTVSGRVGFDAAAGDVVSMTINGQDYSTVVLADKTWNVDVDGSDLAADTSFVVTVIGEDDAGNAFTGSTTSTHTVDNSVGSPAISIAGDTNEDGVYNAEELGRDGTVTATITLPDDFNANTDSLVIKIDGIEYDLTDVNLSTNTVTLEIAPESTITAQITDVAGNESVIASETALSADTSAEAKISLDKVTEDNLVTHDEAASKVTLSGRVGGDAAVGDIVTLTIATAAGEIATYSTKVAADDDDNLGYSYEVDGDVLYAYPDATITASVTGTDSAGNSFNASTSTTYDLGIGGLSDADSDANVVSEGAANGTEVQVTGLAVDPDGDAVTYSLSDDHNGAFAIDATTGVVTVADNSKLDYGSDSAPTIDIIATSEDGTTDTGTFTINLTADTVVAADIGIGTEDTTLIVSEEEGVLSNDSDADDGLSVATFTVDNDDTIYSAGDFVKIDGTGTLTLKEDGSYRFEPVANWSGDVPTVSYVTNTGAESTLSISIEGVNDAAEISLNNESVTVSEKGLEDSTAGTTSATGIFTVSDADGDDLSVSLAAPTETYTSGGIALVWALTDSGDLIGSANGEAIVTVTLDDVDSSGEGSYTVTLNGPVDQPNTTADDSLSIQFGLAVNDGTSTTTSMVTAVIEDDAPSGVTTEAELQLSASTFSISNIASGFSDVVFTDGHNRIGTSNAESTDLDTYDEKVSWGNSVGYLNNVQVFGAGESSLDATEVVDFSSNISFDDSVVVANITHKNDGLIGSYGSQTIADSFDSAYFNVDVTMMIDGEKVTVTLSSKLTEEETSNSLTDNGDSLTLESASTVVVVNGMSYTVSLDGFLVDGKAVNTVTTPEETTVTYSVAAHVELTDSNSAEEYVLTGTLNTDAGADGLDSVVEATTIDDNGTLVVNENGSYSFTPSDALVSALGDTGSQVVEYSYSVVDGDGDSVENTLFITVSGPDADTGTTTTVSGLSGSFYNYDDSTDGNLTTIAQAESIIANQSANATFISTNVDYEQAYNNLGSGSNLDSWLGSDSSSLTYVDQKSTEDSVVKLTGSVSLAAGVYSIKVSADDGYQIKINGESVAAVDHIQAVATDTFTFTVTESGELPIEIVYWDQGGAYQLSVSLAPATVAGGLLGEYQVLGSDAYPTTSTVTDVSDIITDTTDDVVGGDDTPTEFEGMAAGLDDNIAWFESNTGIEDDTTDNVDQNDKSWDDGEEGSYIVGTGNNDTIKGNGGDDHIVGNNSQDDLYGGSGQDWIEGGDGDDHIYGDDSSDLLDGGSGQDNIYGGAGNDILRGEDGDDTLLGEAGNDILIGGQGQDTLTGGDGSDLFILQDPSTDGIDKITDFNVNSDALDVSDLLSGDGVDLNDTDAVTAYLNDNLTLKSDEDGSGSLSVKNSSDGDHQVATFGSDSTLGAEGTSVTVVFNDQEYSVNVDG